MKAVNNNIPDKIARLREASFSVNAAKLFNTLPKNLRDLKKCSVDEFKCKLDTFLHGIPDEPQIVGMTQFRRKDSNSLLDMVMV